MKKINLISLTAVALLLLSFTALQINTNSLFVESYEDIGTIKQSLLKPELFNKTQKGVWILLDGRELDSNTELYKILEEGNDLNILKDTSGSKHLPNALGKFIRSSNYLGKGSDPDFSRLIGTLQHDAFQGHKHNFEGDVLVLPNPNYNPDYLVASGKGSYNPRKKNTGYNNYIGTPTTEGNNGSPRTSSETRPINMSMYTYIKIAK